MIPIIAAMGISVLSTLAGKAVTALIDRNLGGSTAADSGKNSFDTILERSQATKSARAHAKGLDSLPPQGLAPTFAGGLPKDASLGLLTAQLTRERSLVPLTGLLATHQRPLSNSVAGNQIGRKVSANGSLIDLRGPVPPTLQYRLPTAAASVQVEVRDLQGTVIRTVQLGPQSGGLHQLPFDGRGLDSGLYLYRVIATDAGGLPISRVSTASGRVNEVRFEGGQAFLVVGGSLVPLMGVYEASGDQPQALS
ncbi:FlgD immunoglobulin-like domain containing protein [Candidatus Methylomirabilis sp.]|uniref:flagellar hook assembly protein FlgD n=1 Tax=Candidatus Methylomirabilis sp. TaxID=2032687 RepID=UPI002A62277D|nr:FlgD immunoglobulin-like domain containing protein [Candidatus Methylomirabilis sp.]